ncbi:hypothetical protein F5Y16DRAFT_417969 [Xylariaceae sp. FL0255]|nr:hypothetical protein F5Y16DRAFT_417969 [Xylariaceae sp. FL0255]
MGIVHMIRIAPFASTSSCHPAGRGSYLSQPTRSQIAQSRVLPARAKILFDTRFERTRDTVVQATLLLTWHNEGPEDVSVNAWFWLESDAQNLKHSDFQNCGTDCRVDYVMQLSELCKVVSNALRERMRIAPTPQSRKFILWKTDDALVNWSLRLPPSLQHQGKGIPGPWAAHLQLLYNIVLILLHRAQLGQQSASYARMEDSDICIIAAGHQLSLHGAHPGLFALASRLQQPQRQKNVSEHAPGSHTENAPIFDSEPREALFSVTERANVLPDMPPEKHPEQPQNSVSKSLPRIPFGQSENRDSGTDPSQAPAATGNEGSDDIFGDIRESWQG